MIRTIKNLSVYNYLYTIYFNFKMLPFSQAIYFPFIFYYRVRFENLSGKILIKSKKVHRGMVKVGGRGSEMFSRMTTIFDIKGIVEINGITEIGHGTLLRVEKRGKVIFGNNVRIGACSKIFSEKGISFGDEVDFSWECQIFDTNFHFIRDSKTQKITTKVDAIKIGSLNWIGNRCTIMKGTSTPDNFIVASNSLCNKDYSTLEPFSVIGGIPAVFIASNKQRVFENLTCCFEKLR